MGVSTGTTVPRTAGRPTASRISGLRRASFAAFVMLVVQFALGIYVNLYVTVPRADHGHGFGQAIANGPAGLTAHIGLGLLLILAALGFLVQAILARQPALIAAAVLGLLAMVGAAASGSSFTGSGRDGASAAAGTARRWRWRRWPPSACCATAPACSCCHGRRPGVMTADRVSPCLDCYQPGTPLSPTAPPSGLQ